MSFAAMAWAAKQKPSNHTQKFILMMLADCADDDGFCFPSSQYLSEVCMIDRRTVQRNMRLLEEQGFIETEARRRRDGTQTSNGVQLQTTRDNDRAAECHPPLQGGANVSPGRQSAAPGAAQCHPNEPIKEPITNTTTTGARVRAALEEVVTRSTASAIIEHRKVLKAPLSERAAQQLAAQFKLCRDPDDAADYMIERGWRGFKADWYHNRPRNGGADDGRDNSREGALQRLRESRRGDGTQLCQAG